jgi:small subunit ribosomal protein S5
MSEVKQQEAPKAPAAAATAVATDQGNRPARTAGPRKDGRGGPRKPGGNRPKRDEFVDEFEQKIIDLARVTRVMAGGKRMRFRACVAVGNKKGKIGIGLAKGADVTIAISKAVNQAKKDMVDVPMINETIPHEVNQKTGAALLMMKPARKGRGIIAGGSTRIVMELAGVHNVVCKNLGTTNKVNNAKCVLEALRSLKKPLKKAKEEKAEVKKEAVTATVKTDKEAKA